MPQVEVNQTIVIRCSIGLPSCRLHPSPPIHLSSGALRRVISTTYDTTYQMQSVSITMFPPELLELVFFFACSTGLCPTILTFVCRQWMDIVRHSGRLWSFIDLENREKASRHVALSRGYPLTVGWLNRSNGPAAWAAVVDEELVFHSWLWRHHSPRIRSIHLSHTSRALVSLFSWMDADLPELLELSLVNQINQDASSTLHVPLTIKNRAPQLISLFLSRFTVPASTLLGVLQGSPALREISLIAITLGRQDWSKSEPLCMQKLERLTISNMSYADELYLFDRITLPSNSTVVLTGTISSFIHDSIPENWVSHPDVMSHLNRHYTKLEIDKDTMRLADEPTDAFSLVVEARADFFALSGPRTITLSNYDVSSVHTLELSDDFTNYKLMVDLDAIMHRLVALRTVRLLTPRAVLHILPKLAHTLEDKPQRCPSFEHLWLMNLDLDAVDMVKQVTEFIAICASSSRTLQALHLSHCNISPGNYEQLLAGVGEMQIVRSGEIWCVRRSSIGYNLTSILLLRSRSSCGGSYFAELFSSL
ncbi:hypothetical protein PHLGIDRAFT_448247 [Phlebiopsis gigantea 11061_1 CR5-6]|uniref:F-box domain-containing protein n=1 Tax=Phlebiopsis gigantea (strain 11061_1 CR5-6) TaxID=745531 RepID=A0A0C3SA23_PHLG1|nr:hypothetical protein PHLGIDRAFT_448247 [Phlebiopsis gigantea 11061_1 CR5-6]